MQLNNNIQCLFILLFNTIGMIKKKYYENIIIDNFLSIKYLLSIVMGTSKFVL